MTGSWSKMKPKKREGTPDKVTTPSQEIVSDSSKTNVIFDEELEKITIRDDDLNKLRESLKLSEIEDDVLKDVIVQKLKSEEERNKPKQKNVKVLKQAPAESRVRPMEFIGGVRLDCDNNVVPHSILGNVDEFLSEAARRGQVEHLPLPNSRESSTSLTLKYEKKSKKPVDPMLSEDNALRNWQKKMLERKRQQGFISKMVQVPADTLVMNRGDKIRERVEEQHLIDRTIPFIDYGKGYRVGSEFWKQQELFGGDIKGIHMSLTHTEKGYPPVIEHIGVPETIEAEKSIRPASASSINHPWNISHSWNKSAYLHDRKKQLNPLIQELDPHQPQFSRLEVVGRQYAQGDCINRLDLSQVTVPTIEDDSLTREAEHVALIDHIAVSGPSMLFNGTPVTWTGDSYSNVGDLEAEARVTFECYATQRVMSTLEIVNNGTTTIDYEWKHLPLTNPFDIVNCKVQRFYFNTSSGVILPGDSMRVPFIFKSPNAGIFTEQWQFETKPVLAGGAALVVTLRGVAVQEDHFADDRNELESDLHLRQAAQIVSQILDTIVDGIKTPERCRSPIDAFITEEKVFEKQNTSLVYQHHVSGNMKQIYLELHPEEERTWREWDLRVETINELVVRNNHELNEDGNQKLGDEESEVLLQRLNNAVTMASYPHLAPVQHKLYGVGYDLLSDTVDAMVDLSDKLRHRMRLPGREPEEFPDEVSDPRKKVDPNKKASGKLDPGKTKSPEKKGKDSKTAGKASKTPSQTKISPTRNETTTPGIPLNQDSNASLTTDGSKILEENPVEDCYKHKMYSLTYALVSDCVLRMADLFDDVTSTT